MNYLDFVHEAILKQKKDQCSSSSRMGGCKQGKSRDRLKTSEGQNQSNNENGGNIERKENSENGDIAL